MKRILYGEGVAWEMVITVPNYSYDVTNLQHVTNLIAFVFHCSLAEVEPAVRNVMA